MTASCSRSADMSRTTQAHEIIRERLAEQGNRDTLRKALIGCWTCGAIVVAMVYVALSCMFGRFW